MYSRKQPSKKYLFTYNVTIIPVWTLIHQNMYSLIDKTDSLFHQKLQGTKEIQLM